MESQRSKIGLWVSWGLTVAIWLLAGPHLLPGIVLLPQLWLSAAAAFLLLLQLTGPGRGFVTALVRLPDKLRDLPLLLTSWAALLAIAGTALAGWNQFRGTGLTGMGLHLHDASFLVSFHLLTDHLLRVSNRWDRLQALRRLNLTKVMADKLKEAESSTPSFVERTLRRVPMLYGAVAIIVLITGASWFFFAGRLDTGFIQAATLLAICSPWIWLQGLSACFRVAVRTAAVYQTLIGNPTAIELAARLNAIIFGKRGTLTQGSPRVTDIIPMTDIDEEELLLWAASAEHDSHHPFGQAIVREANAQSIPLEPPERFLEMTGRGVVCVIDGQPVRLGKQAFFDKAAIPAFLADRLEILAQEGKTAFMCCRDKEFLGIIAVTEELRPEAAAAIESIRALGLRTIMLTGDDRMMSESLAERLHIDQVIAEVLGKDKTREINKLRRDGFLVGMVGAYPEDNEQFQESELGITLTRGKGRELPPTDVIALEDKLDHVVSFLEISHKAMHIARENRLFAYLYHGLAVLFAAGCLVPFGFRPPSPTVGALISGVALIFTMLNARRISTFE